MLEKRTLTDAELDEIEKIIGYAFADRQLLRRCFTHSSVSAENNNERLEFLGDAVIELCVSEELYRRSGEDEGDMTEWRKKFVANDVLRPAAERLGLHRYFIFSGKKENLGKKPVASLFEALAAGIYLDGGMPAAKAFVREKLIRAELLARRAEAGAAKKDYKSRLQEYMQGRGLPRAEYLDPEKSGPDHRPVYRARVIAQGIEEAGEGGSKAAAQQVAAKKILERLEKEQVQ